MYKKLIKNSEPFGKKFQKTVAGDFFYSHCSYSLFVTSRRRCSYSHGVVNDVSLQAVISDSGFDLMNESLYADYWLVTSPTPDVASVPVVLATVVKATAMLAVVTATLLGNTLVIVGVWRSDKLRSSVSNAFIVSLAGADLMVALLVMPFSAVQVCQIKFKFKSLFESGKSPYTQTHTCIHKTQYTIKEETMKL